jgi:IS5 family transposase
VGSKLIDTYEVTSSEVHDSQVIDKLVSDADKGQELYGDSAYIGDSVDKVLRKKGIIPQIIERAFRGNPLTKEEKESNRIKSKTRCKIEHVYGFVTNNMNKFHIPPIGFKRVKGVIGLINLVYNLCRYEQIVRLNLL